VSEIQNEYSFHVTDARVADEGVEKYVLYSLVVKKKGTDEQVSKREARFNSFMSTYQLLKSMYKKHPTLKSNLPPIPGKDIKMMRNHTDPAFVEKRREGLNDFVTKLATFPGVLTVPGLRDWLGLNDL